MQRINDIEPIGSDTVTLYIDDEMVMAAAGETVLTTLFAVGRRAISLNDYGLVFSAYCGMGVCHCCALNIDGAEKQRACQVLVREGMKISTRSNRHNNVRLNHA